MPLGAGVPSWVLAWHTIERKIESLICTPPPAHTPTFLYKVNKELLTATVPVNNFYQLL